MNPSEDYERIIGRPLHYDRNGQPMDWEAWCLEFEFIERHVGSDELTIGGQPVHISTVWLGLDHGFGMSERPLIFETMVFGGPLDEYQARYATEEEALAGHQEVLDFHKGWRNRLRFRAFGALRRVRTVWGGLQWVIRHPSTARYGWINFGLWTFAICAALFSLVVNLAAGRWYDWVNVFNLAFGTLDAWMLRRALKGLAWRLSLDRKAR